jgi:hypothetical protein
MEQTPLPDPATPPATPPPPPRKKHSRLRTILFIAGGALVVLILGVVFFAPPIIASTIRSQFLSNVHDRIDGTATLGEVTFTWGNGAILRDVSIKDRSGATIAAVKEVHADISILSAVGGRIIADVRVDGPRVELRRAPDGRLNVISASKPGPDAPPKPAGPPRDLPYLEVKLAVNDASVLIAGEKENTEFTASGTFTLIHDKGQLKATGKSAIRRGSVEFTADAHLKGGATTELTIKAVPLDARMGPVLELLHPAFSLAGGRLDGSIDGVVTLKQEGEFDQLPKGLSGSGRIEIRDCTFAGSSMLGELLKAIGSNSREIRIRPVEIRIADGRLVYEKPWQWTMSGSETTFTGSVGLDRTLDLTWHVPVTDDLAARVPALKSSKGRTFEVKIGGTVSKPRLDWKGVVSQAAEDRLEDAARKEIEGLLGGKDEKKARKLLEEADQLHQAGKTAEAAAKYRELKDKYRKTAVYKDNKGRVDPRSEAK